MLSETKLSLLHQLVQSASSEELIWTKGYLAGFVDGNKAHVPEVAVASQAIAVKPTIIYGTETGNSKKVASGLLANFKKNKIQAKTADVFQYDIAKLEKESLVLFVMSTQGEGEFPQNAVAFYEKLKAAGTDLKHLTYAVLGLGDSSYPLFNNAGVLLDGILHEKGAKRLLPLTKADVDYTETVVAWEKELQAVFLNTPTTDVPTTIAKPATSHKKDYTGIISHKVVLNDRGSNKETYHIEITPNDEVQYEPGDALGIVPKNGTKLIGLIAGYFKTDIEKEVTVKGEAKSVQQWLAGRNLTGLSKRSQETIGTLLQVQLTEDKADLADILAVHPVPEGVLIEDIINILLPIAPRLYSISSSAEAHDGQVHLTVNLNNFTAGDTIKYGLASQYLAEYEVGTEVDFYIHKNHNFRLPSTENDIIMIGPGTGIAPFRSFIAHRDATGADGRNWLFFGEQHFVHDFYYQTEIQEWLSSGVLSKLDVAFSRDQKEKIYVQDRIRENGKEFNQWLEGGATLYICGQKSPMSADVENAILEVIAAEREISLNDAKAILETLVTEGRYQKDVY